jgi:hypothetical protein
MKTLLTTIAIVALTLGSCKKSEKTSPEPTTPSGPTVPIKNENDKRKLKLIILGYDSLIVSNNHVNIYNKIAMNAHDSIDVIAYVNDTIRMNTYAARQNPIVGEGIKVYKDYQLDVIYSFDASLTNAIYIVK